MYEKEKTLPSITSTRLKEKYPHNKTELIHGKVSR